MDRQRQAEDWTFLVINVFSCQNYPSRKFKACSNPEGQTLYRSTEILKNRVPEIILPLDFA
jgi:hypothetical protein